MTSLDYAAIRKRISIRQVLELLSYRPRTVTNDQWRGPCPLCSNPGRCLSVQIERNLFRCFNCHRSGNQIDLWMATTGFNLHRAALDLCQQLNITPIQVETSNHQNANHQPSI